MSIRVKFLQLKHERMNKINYDDNVAMIKMIVESGDIPQYIYKYTNLTSLKKIMRSGKVYFSPPSRFNDPFDCNLTIDTNNTQMEIEEYLTELTTKKKLSDHQVKTCRDKMLDPEKRFELTNKSIKEVKESFGISCFSKKFDNLVMWAHYSDKHNGVVIKFDILEDADFFMTPFPIKYKTDYPTFNYLRNKAPLGQFLLETKSIDWQYEYELRIMKRGPGLYKLKKTAIKEIIFGCRVSKSVKNRISRIATRRNWADIKFTSAKMNLREFKLDFIE